jgi:hypothetical protein
LPGSGSVVAGPSHQNIIPIGNEVAKPSHSHFFLSSSSRMPGVCLEVKGVDKHVVNGVFNLPSCLFVHTQPLIQSIFTSLVDKRVILLVDREDCGLELRQRGGKKEFASICQTQDTQSFTPFHTKYGTSSVS